MTTSAPYSNSTTSRAAARSLDQPKTVRDRRAIATFLADCGAKGGADFEIHAGLPDIHENALRARRGELLEEKRRAITDEPGERRINPATGKSAIVYFITDRGLHALGRDPSRCFHVPSKAVRQ